MLEDGPDIFSGGCKGFVDLLVCLSAQTGTVHCMFTDDIEPVRLQNIMTTLNQRQPDLRVSLCCRIDRSVKPANMTIHAGGAIVQIQWRITGPLPDLGFFKTFSRAGAWNHLVLEGTAATAENCRTVSSQPNIVHSWEAVDAGNGSCNSGLTYGPVRPLPGQPLWHKASDPVDRFLLADHLTKARLLRMRVDEDGERIYTVGDALEYHFLAPDALPDGCLDEICAMVAAGGTVADTHVRFNLERAHLIGYVQEKGVIVGNSSLKNPRREYIDTVRRQSGLDLTGFLERGYTSVRPEYRGLGIGTKLLEGLTRRAGDRKIFSVIAEDNAATKVIATRNRTRKVAAYFSEKAGKQVGIWMPEWMIATDGEKRL
jgi:GNAT superfamily N-acetyltransferase